MTTVFSTMQRHMKRVFAFSSSALRPGRGTRTFTLRELLKELEGARSRAILAPPDLTKLLAVVSGDLAVAVRYPERRGGPDTLRTMGAWNTRYNHLRRYLPRE
ncbi:hypothetical protein LVB87_08705 [Lysobacter sp. KIS68-7]|uniref:hypothetical protein n=1 Tax=Lysobacter sp. KIS68-7 TaxID=2904252 RepID=UPI001E30E44B|nr:hypothetical protein [Lysobacter sp. KIS68-7]UHQ18306.1 hypothetical protein LVB87_08705 [Lysobacter sp. KIS68-7]